MTLDKSPDLAKSHCLHSFIQNVCLASTLYQALSYLLGYNSEQNRVPVLKEFNILVYNTLTQGPANSKYVRLCRPRLVSVAYSSFVFSIL